MLPIAVGWFWFDDQPARFFCRRKLVYTIETGMYWVHERHQNKDANHSMQGTGATCFLQAQPDDRVTRCLLGHAQKRYMNALLGGLAP